MANHYDIQKIYDWSHPDPTRDYRKYYQHASLYDWENSIIPPYMKVNRVHVGGWVPSILTGVLKGVNFYQPEL